MQRVLWVLAIPLLASNDAAAGCLEVVDVGDPSYLVVEKCGKPQRRERDEMQPTKRVEVLRGTDSTAAIPSGSRVVERWYYDSSLNAVTVIHLEDGGVTAKERLQREN